MKSVSLLLAVVVFLSSCSAPKSLVIPYTVDKQHTGKIEVKPSKPMELSVRVNGNRIADGSKKVKDVTITNVPAGDYALLVETASWQYAPNLDTLFNLSVRDGELKQLQVNRPPYSKAYKDQQTATLLAMVALFITNMVSIGLSVAN